MKILLLLFAKVSLFVFFTAVPPQHAVAANLSNSEELLFSDGVNNLRARLYRPPGFDTSSNQFPLVLFLHGVGERGADNVTQVSYHIDGLIAATQGTNFAAFLLAPQLPAGADWRQATWRALTLAVLQSVQTNNSVDSRRAELPSALGRLHRS